MRRLTAEKAREYYVNMFWGKRKRDLGGGSEVSLIINNNNNNTNNNNKIGSNGADLLYGRKCDGVKGV